MANEVAVPSLAQLDNTINASNVDEDNRDHSGNGEQLHSPWEGSVAGAVEEIAEKENEDRDGEHLKRNTSYHRVGAWCCVVAYCR